MAVKFFSETLAMARCVGLPEPRSGAIAELPGPARTDPLSLFTRHHGGSLRLSVAWPPTYGEPSGAFLVPGTRVEAASALVGIRLPGSDRPDEDGRVGTVLLRVRHRKRILVGRMTPTPEQDARRFTPQVDQRRRSTDSKREG